MTLGNNLNRAVEAYGEAWWGRPWVAAIPYVGGFIDALVTSRAASIQRTRFERFLALLKEGYERISEEKLDKTFLESEEFFDLFAMVSERAIRTHDAEKLEALRNAFVNATTTEGSSGPFKEIAIRIAGDLTAAHMVFLQAVYERESRFTAADVQANENYTNLAHVISVLGTATPSDLEALGQDLVTMGLLANWWLGRYGGPNMEESRFALTQFGKRFIWFITDQSITTGVDRGK